MAKAVREKQNQVNVIGTKVSQCLRKSRESSGFKGLPLGQAQSQKWGPKLTKTFFSPSETLLCHVPVFDSYLGFLWYSEFYLSPPNCPGTWSPGPNPSLHGVVPSHANS